MSKCLISLILAVAAWAQTAPPKTGSPAAPPKKAATPASAVDNVIELLKGGMSEGFVIKQLQREGKLYSLTTSDLLKLQKAGVSERVIEVMTDPKAGAATTPAPTMPDQAPAPAMPGPAASAPPVEARADPAPPTGPSTAFPPDLESAPKVRKRRVDIEAFDYSAVKTWVTYWFHNDVNIGAGIQSMMIARMGQLKNITLVERKNLSTGMREQDFGQTNRVKQGTKAKVGNISGADCILVGDITIFGRDDKQEKKSGIFHTAGIKGIMSSAFTKEEKAVVAIALRIVDAETLEVLETAEARGESSRKSHDYSGLLGTSGGGITGAQGMTSQNFAETIIGEATSDAVTKALAFLQDKIPNMSPKARNIEGHVANITPNAVYITVGDNDGVLLGDRFEILRITGEIRDPATKEVIDVEATKIGELVVNNVRDKTAIGTYGGEPLSSAYAGAVGKGYAARLMSK